MALAESRGTILAGKFGSQFRLPSYKWPNQTNVLRKYLVMTGSDTTGTAITSTLFHLMTNPSIMAKLRHEIDMHYNEIGDMFNSELLSKLPYLNAVM